MRILIASNNSHKVEEIREILGSAGVSLTTPKELGLTISEPVEDGRTLEENAYIKAAEYFAATGMPTLADDTGLEVDALDGAPGVYSARYAGEEATYSDNCDKLMRELSAVSQPQRTARFRTVICFVDSARTVFAEGIVEGAIVDTPRGQSGFGYDPLFLPEGETRTFAEMAAKEKNAISHRGRALADMRTKLELFIKEGVGA